MSIWELPKEHYNWESPIAKIYGDIHNEIIRQDEENCTFAIEQAIGYKVDKGELIKALQYDRNQYDKGYNDGVKETFVTELEKIKAEIEKDIEIKKKQDYSMDFFIGVCNCLIMIENRISELKGERECTQKE